MTATQVIEEIKLLPKKEQEQVYAFLRERENAKEGLAPARHADDRQFEAALDKVFDTHAGLLRRLAK
ncbi:MAG: hypothetical protein HYY24_14315 [Verrucomicrobia bacterium]|nr:hypothetical protein [Verrucomicrobiota bacterium]